MWQNASAGTFSLPQLDTGMVDPLFNTLATALAFRPMEPASDLGRNWGSYLGLSAGVVDASSLSNIFLSGSGSNQILLPSADVQFGLGLPYGFTLEGAYLPAVSYQGTSFSRYSGGIKWTLTRTALKPLPFDLAAQAGYSQTALNYTQGLSGGTVDVSYKTAITSGNLLLSKRLLYFFEPYVGIGFVHHYSTLSGTGSATLFGNTFPIGTESINGSGTSLWTQAGLLIKLLVVGTTVEYDNMFGQSSLSAKVSIRI